MPESKAWAVVTLMRTPKSRSGARRAAPRAPPPPRGAVSGASVGASSPADLQEAVEDRLRDLQHLGGGLVALLELDQAGRLLVEVDARLLGHRRLGVGGDRRRL